MSATLTPTVTRELLAQMVLIRRFETEAERQYKAANIGGYCHLSSGQEATSVGAIHPLEDDDLLVTGYRAHGLALARGMSPDVLMAELFGRRDGCARWPHRRRAWTASTSCSPTRTGTWWSPSRAGCPAPRSG